MARKALDILQLASCVRVSSSGMGTFVNNITSPLKKENRLPEVRGPKAPAVPPHARSLLPPIQNEAAGHRC